MFGIFTFHDCKSFGSLNVLKAVQRSTMGCGSKSWIDLPHSAIFRRMFMVSLCNLVRSLFLTKFTRWKDLSQPAAEGEIIIITSTITRTFDISSGSCTINKMYTSWKDFNFPSWFFRRANKYVFRIGHSTKAFALVCWSSTLAKWFIILPSESLP